jgi:hypothetical protein
MKSFRTTKITGLFALLTLLFATSSCIDDIFLEGNGITQSEFRMASGFNEVASSGDFDVIVEPGSSYSIEVTAESNLLSYIETDVVGNTLKIRTRGLYSLRQNEPIEIRITTPMLKGVTLSGSGYIQTGSFMSDDFRIVLSGSGDINTLVSADQIKANVSGSGSIFLEGDAYETEFVISGSGKIKSYNLEQEYCQAAISGSGDMYVNVSRAIDASISGSGRVYYVNYPVIHTSVSGSGGVVDQN